MKKLIAVLMALCLLCAAAAALAETTEEPHVITVDEGVELTEKDFEGVWVVEYVKMGDELMSDEDVTANFTLGTITIADKTVTIVYDEESSATYPCYAEANQLHIEEEGNSATFEKLSDGNLVMSQSAEAEDGTTICFSFFLVHPAE